MTFWKLWDKQTKTDNRTKISISAESREEADKLFNGLSAGGKIEMPIADSPWGSYFGMFATNMVLQWMVDFDPRYYGQKQLKKNNEPLTLAIWRNDEYSFNFLFANHLWFQQTNKARQKNK